MIRSFRLRGISVSFVLAVSLLGTSCFEDPVEERLQLDIKDGETIALSLKVEINAAEVSGGPLESRIRELQAKFLRGDDDWSRRFDLVSPLTETVKWRREHGRLKVIERDALLEATDLSRFLSDTALTFNATHGAGWSELTIYPGQSKRATRQQQSEVSGRLDDWCSKVSLYLSSLARVYGYVDKHPDRNEAVLGAVLKEEMGEEAQARLPPLSEGEQGMVSELNDRMGGVSSILTVDDQAAYSLNEISSLVFDPFPAILTIHVPAKILEREGFESTAEQTVRVPRLTLWEGLLAMRDRWITPDPLLAKVESSRDSASGKKLDLPAFLARERRVVSLPSGEEVKAALTGKLRPGNLYRVRWMETDSRGAAGPG
ncbi:MAG: hypothetical protein ABI837_09500 [Acidobacteriota bacterium]